MTTPANASLAFASQIGALCGIYPVTDTTIGDHGNAATVGSIAYQVAAADAASGGTVVLGPGTFTVTSAAITLPVGVNLIGAGRGTSLINQTGAFSGVIASGAQNNFYVGRLGVNMPAGATSAHGSFVFGGSYGTAEDLYTTGGSVNSWGFIFDNFYNWNCRGLRVSPQTSQTISNGLLLHNSSSNFNIGDSNFVGIHIRVKDAAIGLKMISDNVGAGTASVNDNTFINLQVLGNAPASGNTVIGISGSKAPRNTFIQCDFENVQEVMNMASDCVNNMFQSCNDWGSVSLTDASTSSVYVNGAGSGLFAAKNTL